MEDVLIFKAQSAPPKAQQMVIPPGILPPAPFVVGAIELDDEPRFGCSKVDDEVGDDELSPEGDAEP